MIQRAREELEKERRALQRRRPNCEVKEKLSKTYTRAKSKDRSFVHDESSNDGTTKSNTDKSYVFYLHFFFSI